MGLPQAYHPGLIEITEGYFNETWVFLLPLLSIFLLLLCNFVAPNSQKNVSNP